MEVQKVIRKIHKLQNALRAADEAIEAAQEYIEQLKQQRFTALLAGLILGTLSGIFWRELWKWITNLL